MQCLECGGETERTIAVLPGGKARVPVCHKCSMESWSEAVKRGLERAKYLGVKLGRPKIRERTRNAVWNAWERGQTYGQIARRYGVSRGTAHAIVKERLDLEQ